MHCRGKKGPGKKWSRRSYHLLLVLQVDLASTSNLQKGNIKCGYSRSYGLGK